MSAPTSWGRAASISGLAVLAWWSPSLAQAQARNGAYVARRAGAVITRERYRFDGTALTTEVEILQRGMRLEARTEYAATLAPRRYQVAVRAASSATVLQDLSATFGDSVRWTLRAGGATRSGSSRITRPYGMFQNLLFSQLAVMLLRYDRGAGGVQVLDVWLPEGSHVGQLRMALKGDTGHVELGGVNFAVTTDPSGWLRSVNVPVQGLTVAWEAARATDRVSGPMAGAADTVPPPAVHESTWAFASGSYTLEGTLTVPVKATGKIPVALIVAGSGAADRNGNSPLLRSNTYAQLAWRLAERAIATVRYDKRGIGASRPGVEVAKTTFDDLASDVTAAAGALRRDARFGPVALIGHSEGALLGVRAAASGAPVAGVALLSAPGRSFAEVVHQQLAFQIGDTAARRFDQVFPKYLAGEDVANPPDYLRPLLLPVNRAFTKSLAAFDPLSELRKVRVPVLIVQGGADLQVGVHDAELLKSAKPDAELAVIPDANHLFKAAKSRDRMAQMALYLDPTIPIVPGLAATLALWIGELR